MLPFALLFAAVGPGSPLARVSGEAPTPPPHTLIAVETAPLSPEVSPRLAAKATELLRSALAAQGAEVMPQADMEKLRAGATTAAPPDLSAARTALAHGKDLYLNLELDKAAENLESARSAFEAALPQTGDFSPLADALTYLAACAQGLHQGEAANARFLELLRYRPSYALDARVFPPDLLDAFARAKAQFARSARAPLAVSSAPPLATVTLDGDRRGETPLTIDGVPVGKHAYRVDAAGFQPQWGTIEVGPTGAQAEVRLQPNQTGDDLRALEAEAKGAGARALMLKQGSALARSAGVDASVASGLTRVDQSYVVSAAMVDAQGGVRVAWTAIDADFLAAPAAFAALSRALFEQPGPAFAEASEPQPAGAHPDFAAALLGFTAAPPEVASGPAAAPSHPFYKQWWFWTSLAVGAAATGGTVYYFQSHRPVEIQQQPNTTAVTIQVQQ